MPVTTEGLPSTIERSPKKVQRTYEEALDNAHREYRDEERAHRTAWAAVKHIAEKKGDHWELKDRKGPSDPQAARGGAAARRGTAKTFGGVDVNKPKRELYEEARRAGIEGRSQMTKEELAEALRRHSERSTRKARERRRR
jgi:cation transport regulator ChaB